MEERPKKKKRLLVDFYVQVIMICMTFFTFLINEIYKKYIIELELSIDTNFSVSILSIPVRY
jgi:hypothetical protein